MDKPIAKLKLLTTEGEVVDAILYCHQETTTIGGTTYYLLKLDTPADASGTTLSASTGSVARVVWGKFVYPLTGIAKILASTIYATYRAYTGGGTVNAEIDILILKADGTVRTTIATGVSPSANLGSSWATYTGANYSFVEYTVVDQTDYLEIDYIANVTAKKATQYAYLRIDDNTLALADQTRSQEWKFTGVTTLSATNITINSATLNGQINGTETMTIRGFEWGTQSGNYTDSWTESGAFPPDTFSYNLTNLSPGTTYYFRAKAYSDATGWIYGNELSFGWLVGWSYRKSHVINPSSGAGTNYQVKITAHYGSGSDSGADVYLNGKCRTDFGDIRFTLSDGTTLLDYWMESKVDGDYAVFWVEVADDLSTNPVTIYIYYGNPNATTTSNGANTFLFFDDFNVDLSKWTVRSGTWTLTTDSGYSVLESDIIDNAQIVTSGFTILNCRIKARFRLNVVNTPNFFGVMARTPDSNNYYYEQYGSPYTNPSHQIYKCINGTHTLLTYVSLTSDTNYHISEFLLYGTNLKAYLDGAYALSVTDSSLQSTAPVGLRHGSSTSPQSDAYFFVDWFFVSKYVSPEPSHGSWGSEETVAVAEAIVAKNFPMDYLPSPAKATQLTSKVSGATITTVSQDYPLTLIKKDKAQELISKFSTT
jgi:hypothetical protein